MNHVSLAASRVDPVARARDLGPAIEAVADDIERTQTIPEPLLTRIHDARLARMMLPRVVQRGMRLLQGGSRFLDPRLCLQIFIGCSLQILLQSCQGCLRISAFNG